MLDRIVEIARKEEGYTELPGNYTKYGLWFGLNNTPWCAIFVSWCYAQADRPLPKIGWKSGYASCQYAYEWAREHKFITRDPQPGDIVIYNFNRDRRQDHTGIFVRWTDATRTLFEAIEGNTSPDNDANGGCVMKRIRNKKYSTFVHIP